MKLQYYCKTDRTVFSTLVLDLNVRLMGVIIDCPVCRRPIELTSEIEDPDAKMVSMSVEDLFKASNGMGMPGLDVASLARVKFLLSEATKISDVELVEVTPERVLIEKLTVKTSNPERTYTLHFGSSTKGATIYKVTTP